MVSTIPVERIARIIDGINYAKPIMVVKVVIRIALPILFMTSSIDPGPRSLYLWLK